MAIATRMLLPLVSVHWAWLLNRSNVVNLLPHKPPSEEMLLLFHIDYSWWQHSCYFPPLLLSLWAYILGF